MLMLVVMILMMVMAIALLLSRNLCFVGGIDLAFTRWDDERHRVADEEGLMYEQRMPQQHADVHLHLHLLCCAVLFD